MRRQLLRHIDDKLGIPRTSLSEVIAAISGYCLVTSASSIDAVKHLQHLRLERLRQSSEIPRAGYDRVVEELHYLLTSLRIMKALLGRTLNEALSNLQKRPILEDHEIRSLEQLDLNGSRNVIPHEILSFIPYFKRGIPSMDDAQIVLQSWSSEACRALKAGLSNYLSQQSSIDDVLELRKVIFTSFLPVYFSTASGNELFQGLRQTLNARIEELCEKEMTELELLAVDLIEPTRPGSRAGYLWQAQFVKMPLKSGAGAFLEQVKCRQSGITLTQARAGRALHAWIASIKTIQSRFVTSHTMRWRDRIEEPDDEQEEEADEVATTLTQKDSQGYLHCLQASLQTSFKSLEARIHKSSRTSIRENRSAEAAVTLIRGIRQSALPLRAAFPDGAIFKDLDGIVHELHEVIGAEIASKSLGALTTWIDNHGVSTGVTSPEHLPSPGVIALLRQLSRTMTETGGSDIWSAAAVQKVKDVVGNQVFGESMTASLILTEFDQAYLRAALNRIQEDDISGQDKDTVKLGIEYWTRTRLLFGLLY